MNANIYGKTVKSKTAALPSVLAAVLARNFKVLPWDTRDAVSVGHLGTL